MVQRSQPPVFKQPLGSHKCWAYALASWMKVTADRTATPPEEIIKACKNFLADDRGGLNPKFIAELCDSQFIRMGFKMVKGPELNFVEMRDLVIAGYPYVIRDEVVEKGATKPPAHAWIVWSTTPMSQTAFKMGIADPIRGIIEWSLGEAREAKRPPEDPKSTTGRAVAPPRATMRHATGGRGAKSLRR
jgi:hypothetical protein